MPPKRKAAKPSTTAVPRSITELEQVLRAFLGGDQTQFNPNVDINEVIRSATTTLKAFIKLPASIPALITRISMNDSPVDTRQLACVLLTKNIKLFWTKLHKSHFLSQSINDAESCRQHIMTILHSGTAPQSLVHSLAYLTAVIARLDFAKKRFQQLPEWINGALQSTNPLHVDAALRLVSNILNSSVSSTVEAHFDLYYKSSIHWMTNPPNNVIRHRALVALDAVMSKYFNDLDDDGNQSQSTINPGEMIPHLLSTLSQAAQNRDFSSVKTIAGICSSFMGSHGFEATLIPTLEAFRTMVHNTEYDFPIRDSFAYFFADVVEAYPKLISQQHKRPDGSTGILLDVYLQVITDLLCEENDDPWDAEETNHPHLIGVRIIEKLFSHTPLEQLYLRLSQLAVQLLQSHDPQIKKGGFFITILLSQYSTGLFVHRKNLQFNGQFIALNDIWLQYYAQVVSSSDISKVIFDGTCIGMANIIDNIGDHYFETGSFIAPLEQTLAALQISPIEKRFRLMGVLSELADTAKMKITPYLKPVMDQIGLQLTIQDYLQQEIALRAVTNLSLATDVAFLPYFEPLVPILETIILQESTPEIESVQHAAYICLSSCARAIGIENWTPEIQQKLLHLAGNCIIEIQKPGQNNHNLVHHYSVYLGNVAGALSDLPQLTEEAISSLSAIYDTLLDIIISFSGCHFYNQDEDATTLKGFEDVNEGDGDDDDDDDADEDDEVDEKDEYYFDDGAVAAKVSAIDSLSILVTSLGPRLYQLKLKPKASAALHLTPEVFELAGGAPASSDYSLDPVVRIQEAIFQQIALLQDQCADQQYALLGTIVVSVLGPMLGENFQKAPGVTYPLPEQFVATSLPIIRIFIAAMADEDEEIVSEALFQMQRFLQHFGLSIFSDKETTDEFLTTVRDLVFERAPCFIEDTEYRDEGATRGEFALENTAGFVGQLASAMGPVFFVDFFNAELLERMIKLCGPGRTDPIRAIWIGAFADILDGCGVFSQNLIPQLIPLTKTILETCGPVAQRNALFCLSEAIYVLNLVPELKAQLPAEIVTTLFQLIASLFSSPQKYQDATTEDKGFHDNAVSAALRFSITFPEIIPHSLIPQILSIFPLKGDPEEIVKIITQSITTLFTIATETMRPYVGQTLAQIAMILFYRYHLERPAAEPILVQFAKQLMQSFPQEAQTAPQHLSQENSQAISALQALTQ